MEHLLSHIADSSGNELPLTPAELRLAEARRLAVAGVPVAQSARGAEGGPVAGVGFSAALVPEQQADLSPKKRALFEVGGLRLQLPVLVFEFSRDRDALLVVFAGELDISFRDATALSVVPPGETESVSLKSAGITLSFPGLPVGDFHLFTV